MADLYSFGQNDEQATTTTGGSKSDDGDTEKSSLMPKELDLTRKHDYKRMFNLKPLSIPTFWPS